MKLFRQLLIAFIAIVPLSAFSAVGDIIPHPVKITEKSVGFTITPRTKLCCDAQSSEVAHYLGDYLNKAMDCKMQFTALNTGKKNKGIELITDSSLNLPDEGYKLDVDDKGITILAKERNGLFYGVQTLLQLMPNEVYAQKKIGNKLQVAGVSIEDYPAMSYRGVMLDVARTFYNADQVKRQIDFLSYHKLNRLHWHFTEDEAWRAEIKAIPELTSIAGFRGGDSPVKPIYGKFFDKYGGYYTQDQMRDVVEYARIRGIEVIPEIDLPGHSRATGNIFPQMLCCGEVDTVTTFGYDMRNVLCASREENYRIIETIISELSDIFPSKTFHIGGDEVNYSQWLSCPNCKAFMKERGFTTGLQLQHYFTDRLVEIVHRHGKRVGVWDEASEDAHLTKDAHVYCWHTPDYARRATAAGYKSIMMASPFFYIDMRQSEYENGPRWSSHTLDSDWMLNFKFSDHWFTADEMKNIIGMECPLWAETLLQNGVEIADYYLYPRLSALSQMSWGGVTGDTTTKNRFNETMRNRHFYRLAEMGCRARMRPMEFKVENGTITANTEIPNTKIHFTNDGSDPTRLSPLYTVPINDKASAKYRFRAYYKNLETPICVADSAYFDFLRPNITITSSMPESPDGIFSNINLYDRINSAAMIGPCLKGDWVTMTFDAPIEFEFARICTGSDYMPRYIMVTGYVELSSDGVNFKRHCDLQEGRCIIRPDAPVKAIKIVNTHDGNYEAEVRLFSPEIHRKR